MRVTWEERDIVAGRLLKLSNGATETWRIGWASWINDSDARWVLVSQSDGLVTEPESKKVLAQRINNSELLPQELLPQEGLLVHARLTSKRSSLRPGSWN